MAGSSIAERYLKTLETNTQQNAPKSPPRSIKQQGYTYNTPISSKSSSSPVKVVNSPTSTQPKRDNNGRTSATSLIGSPSKLPASRTNLKGELDSSRSLNLVTSDSHTSEPSPTRRNIGPKPDRNPLMHNQDLTPSQVSWDRERKNWQTYEYLCHVVEAKEWMEKVLGEMLPPAEQFPEALQDGIALAKIVKRLRPDLMKWPIFEHKRLQYRHTENISLFFDLLHALNIPQLFLFDMTDLYEKRNLPKVIYCIHAVSHFVAESEFAVSAVDNLVGKLEFSDAQINTTERGLVGHSLPNFGAMTRQLSGKQPKLTDIDDHTNYDEESFDSHISNQYDDAETGEGSFNTSALNEVSDSDDSVINFKPLRRNRNDQLFTETRLSDIRKASREFYNDRYSQYDRRQYRGYSYRNLSSTGSLRTRVMNSAEMMLEELEALEPEIIAFQALCRRTLTLKSHLKPKYEAEVINFITRLQASCRGRITRKHYAQSKAHLNEVQMESLVNLQAFIRSRNIRREFGLVTTKASHIVHFQGLARGVLLRRSLSQLKSQLQAKESTKTVMALQSAFRGIVVRFRLGCLYDDLDQHIIGIIGLQARARGSLVRQDRISSQQNWEHNVDKVILLQSVWRAKTQGARYRTLIADSNPTLEAIKPFLHLIDNKSEDIEQELELETIMKEISRKVKENEYLESRIDQIDMKISLLVKNNISIDEIVLQHQKQNQDLREQLHRERNIGDEFNIRRIAKRNVNDSGLKESFDPNSLEKTSRDRIELYQGLFYLLQTQPAYLSKLMANKPPKSLDMAELVLAVFDGANLPREQFFLLRSLSHCITQSTVGSPENTGAWCIVSQLNKRNMSTKVAKLILTPGAEKLKACYDQLLEYDPHIIYENLTGGADLNAEEAIQDPAVRALFIQNLQRLREITMTLVQSLSACVSELPYHIKFLAREVFREVLRVSKSRKEAMAAVGQVIISQYLQPALLSADSLDLVDSAAGNTAKNLVLVSRVLHQVGLMAPFESSGSTDVYLQPLNEFVKSSSHQLSLQFQTSIIECPDLSSYYNFSELDDITMHERPILNISVDHILALHYMCFQNISSIVPVKDNMLKPLVEQLGPLPKDAREMLDLARFKEIKLELNPKYGTASLSESSMNTSSLLVTTIRCLGYVLRIQNNQPDLMSVLIAPVELEHEHQYNLLLDTDSTREAAGELGNLSFRELKLLTLEKVLELESSGCVSRRDGYQALINAIADDIRNKDGLRKMKAKNMETKRNTLKGLLDKCEFLQQRLDTYSKHVEEAMIALQTEAHNTNLIKGKRGFQLFQLPSSKQGHGQDKHSPKFGQYKTTAEKLYERGILIRLRGYEDRQRKDVQFTFSCDRVGVFQLEILYKGILLPNGTVVITLDDLLTHQYENHSQINLIGNELQFSTNRFLQLILHKFFGTV